MPYNVNQLISGAYHAAGIVSREFETVSGPELADGLLWLNNILTEKDVDDAMIPYESTYTSNFVAGQSDYFIPNLVQIDTLVFYLDTVRYAMMYEKRNQFFGSNRAENIQSLPFEWYFERGKGGGTLSIYFTPDRNYPLEIHGTFSLSEVTPFQDLSLIFDQFYITYLRYCLADRICSEYNFETPQGVLKQLGKYESFIAKKSRLIDLRMVKTSSLQRRGSMNYAFINLSYGFVPPS